ILTQCWVQVDFTYFQTFVDVPANVTVDAFAITFNGIDDGARISIYNSAYPSGTVVAGSYVFLGGAGTSDLADLIVSGEINRVVITQMDDCPTGNNLHEARVNLNGTVVQANQAPVAVAVGDATLECAGPAGTSAALDGSGSSDVDGDALTYTWTDADGNVLATGATASVLLPVGTHVITLTVDDGNGATDTDEVTVTIEDTIAPSIAISGGPLSLWAPNHKYHTISLSGVVSVTDQCSGDLGTGSIASVSSDEPDETAGKKNGKGKGPRGGGDGNTVNDIVILDCQTVDLRAERLGGGNGRVYTVNVAAADGVDLTAAASFEVHVPHDQDTPAVADAPIFTIDAPASCAPAARTVAKVAASGDATTEAEKPALALEGTAPDAVASSELAAKAAELPAEFALEQNYPNPFNPTTTITFALPEASAIVLRVYNMMGQEIDVLVDGSLAAGRHEVRFDAAELSNGVYVYVLEAGSFRSVRRMVLMK
ncbi:MAG: PKD domain-containing protein, partial [Rhodothermales bacterium]